MIFLSAVQYYECQKYIDLMGLILRYQSFDDLILLNYRESLDKKSKNITLFAPDGTSNPYYVETGWKQLSNSDKINFLVAYLKRTAVGKRPGAPRLLFVDEVI